MLSKLIRLNAETMPLTNIKPPTPTSIRPTPYHSVFANFRGNTRKSTARMQIPVSSNNPDRMRVIAGLFLRCTTASCVERHAVEKLDILAQATGEDDSAGAVSLGEAVFVSAEVDVVLVRVCSLLHKKEKMAPQSPWWEAIIIELNM